MLIKFLRPVQGFAYFEGDVGNLDSSLAAPLVQSGQAIMIPETDHEPQNTLPADLPFRGILFKNGYFTAQAVIDAGGELSLIKQIGPKGHLKIVQYFEELFKTTQK